MEEENVGSDCPTEMYQIHIRSLRISRGDEVLGETGKRHCSQVEVILNLADNVLCQVEEKDTALKVWNKLESLYMLKSLSNKIYLKEQLFGFRMDPSKNLEENLDEFKKITMALDNIDEKISFEN